MTQPHRRIDYEPGLTEEQRLLSRFCAALVADPSKLGKLGGKRKGYCYEPEVVLANIIGEAMKQPSKFFRLMMASYRATCGSDETRDRFVASAMRSPYLAGADVLMRSVWNALWQRDLPEDDILREHPAPWIV